MPYDTYCTNVFIRERVALGVQSVGPSRSPTIRNADGCSSRPVNIMRASSSCPCIHAAHCIPFPHLLPALLNSRVSQLEVLLRLRQASNVAFSFLSDGDLLHSYYLFLKSWGESALASEYVRQQRLQAERADEKDKQTIEEDKAKLAEERATLVKGPWCGQSLPCSLHWVISLTFLRAFSPRTWLYHI